MLIISKYLNLKLWKLEDDDIEGDKNSTMVVHSTDNKFIKNWNSRKPKCRIIELNIFSSVSPFLSTKFIYEC